MSPNSYCDIETKIGDNVGSNIFSAIIAQGLPADPIFLLANSTEDENIADLCNKSVKKQESVNLRNLEKFKKQWQRTIQKQYPNIDKIYSFGSGARQDETESLLLLRHVSTQRRRPNSLRDHRPHLMAESVKYEESNDSVGRGIMKVEGYIRCGGGNSFLSWSVNRLVHISGWGDFQVVQVDSKMDPHPLLGDKAKLEKKIGEREGNGMCVDLQNEIQTIAVADPEIQEQLIFENEPDLMEGEQTWPTEEELNAIPTHFGH